jgi:hypothetical protein
MEPPSVRQRMQQAAAAYALQIAAAPAAVQVGQQLLAAVHSMLPRTPMMSLSWVLAMQVGPMHLPEQCSMTNAVQDA